MSTVTDVLPYMQHWLDSRAPMAQTRSDFNAAKSALATARTAVAARVQAGDTAVQMSALITAVVTAKTNYATADAAVRAADATMDARRARFEEMVELLANGQDVPPFTS